MTSASNPIRKPLRSAVAFVALAGLLIACAAALNAQGQSPGWATLDAAPQVEMLGPPGPVMGNARHSAVAPHAAHQPTLADPYSSHEAVAAPQRQIPVYPDWSEVTPAPAAPYPSAAPYAAACGPNPAAPYAISAVDCATCTRCGELGWGAARPMDFQPYAQGEYVGHHRLPHVHEYRLRVDDQLDLIFRLTREETTEPYQLNVGDQIRVESIADPTLDRDLIIQPDGTITLRLLGQVRATRRTVEQLREALDDLYLEYYTQPAITVTPIRVNTKLEDLRATVDARAGVGGQSLQVRITPEGTIGLPALGSVSVQGLTLSEVKREIDARYDREIEGIEVTPVLVARAPRYVYVLGEVRTPGRFVLEGPTTVMQALSMAGGWNPGGNLRQIVVFRRGDDWRLLATMLDLRGALLGHMPCPADEIWLNDSDIVVVPKHPVQIADEIIGMVFSRGIYGVVPFGSSVGFSYQSTL